MDRPLTQPPPRTSPAVPACPPARVCVVGPRSQPGVVELVERLRQDGHPVSALCPAELASSTLPLEGSRALADSYLVYQHLRKQSFDVVYFSDRGAPGYFS